MVKNLAQLKRTLVKGAEFEIVAHARQGCVGQHRRVNAADSTGFYSIIPDKPESRETLANNGKGSYLGWSKAAFWKFESGICTLYDSDKSFTPEHIIISLKVVIGGDSVNYPVSEKKCARCSACQMVTKDISGAPLEEKEMYYQCIAMAECICAEQEE